MSGQLNLSVYCTHLRPSSLLPRRLKVFADLVYLFILLLGVRERQTEESGAEFSLESGDTVDVINCQQSLFVCEKDITLTWTSNLFGFTLDLVKS